MSMIIAGHFAQRTQADGAVQTLLSGGISPDHIINAGHMSGMFELKAASNDGNSSPEDTTMMGPAGYLVAVSTPVDAERAFAAGVMRQHGASDVEETERLWRDGKWVELDMAAVPPPADKSFW
jgi:hypothetical protein